MERGQFTFYASFYEAISRIKNKAYRCDAYDAICKYALTGEAPDLDKLPDVAAIAFVSAQANIDASRRKARAGKAGGRVKQSESKAKANGKQSESKGEANRKQEETASKGKSEANDKQEKEQEQEKEQDKDKDKEQMLYPPISLPSGRDDIPPTEKSQSKISQIMDYYGNRINSMPDRMALEAFTGFLNDGISADVIIHAIDKAVSENVRKLSYINGILRDYQSRGAKTMAQVAVVDEDFNRRKQAAKEAKEARMAKYAPVEPTPEERAPTAESIENMKKLLEKIKEE